MTSSLALLVDVQQIRGKGAVEVGPHPHPCRCLDPHLGFRVPGKVLGLLIWGVQGLWFIVLWLGIRVLGSVVASLGFPFSCPPKRLQGKRLNRNWIRFFNLYRNLGMLPRIPGADVLYSLAVR